jgi:hypothetical protein
VVSGVSAIKFEGKVIVANCISLKKIHFKLSSTSKVGIVSGVSVIEVALSKVGIVSCISLSKVGIVSGVSVIEVALSKVGIVSGVSVIEVEGKIIVAKCIL